MVCMLSHASLRSEAKREIQQVQREAQAAFAHTGPVRCDNMVGAARRSQQNLTLTGALLPVLNLSILQVCR